jgi:hypothetical protein
MAMTYRTITAVALLLIALPITAVKAQMAFNPDVRVTPAQWMRNCVSNFEGLQKPFGDALPPTEFRNTVGVPIVHACLRFLVNGGDLEAT